MKHLTIWDGKRQVRDYTFKDGVLSYAVPANARGLLGLAPRRVLMP
jgi:hypothetical protein